jgi:preprotein translocase subunit Sec63
MDKTHILHFRHVVQKNTWIIITILSQQIKQINSIEPHGVTGKLTAVFILVDHTRDVA